MPGVGWEQGSSSEVERKVGGWRLGLGKRRRGRRGQMQIRA